MEFEKFVQKAANVKAENTLLKFVVVVLTIAVIFSSWFSFRALKYQKTVLVPAVIDRRIEISGRTVSKDYIKLFTKHIMNLAFDYTPATVRAQFDDLLTLCTPEFYPVFKQTLDDIADRVKQLSVSSAFYPQEIIVNFAEKTIRVTGIKRQWAEGNKIEDGKKTYLLKFVIRDGRFWLNGFEEVKNNA